MKTSIQVGSLVTESLFLSKVEVFCFFFLPPETFLHFLCGKQKICKQQHFLCLPADKVVRCVFFQETQKLQKLHSFGSKVSRKKKETRFSRLEFQKKKNCLKKVFVCCACKKRITSFFFNSHKPRRKFTPFYQLIQFCKEYVNLEFLQVVYIYCFVFLWPSPIIAQVRKERQYRQT